uniref:Uncharacterized protein n=1 Tax=Populus alba TaxID=43335 RepID=A0A4U5PLY3_POPAL|nr:hypothetical protein D5086_0000206110 [Populus alba]
MQTRILAAWELAKGTSNLLGGRLWKKQQLKAVIESFQQAKLTKHGPNPLFGGLKSTSSVFWKDPVICGSKERECFTLCASTKMRAPGTGELVVFGVDAMKPFMELGIVSADGKRLVHKADLKFNRCTLSHDMGVTERYNVIMDFPLTIRYYRDSSRKAVSAITLTITLKLIKFEKEEYARIGIMPRYGNADSIRWFEVEPNCTFHILNCFEEGDEVVVRGIAGPSKSIISEILRCGFGQV